MGHCKKIQICELNKINYQMRSFALYAIFLVELKLEIDHQLSAIDV